MDLKNKPVDFSKTTFYKGMNATFGKIPVSLEVSLDIQDALHMEAGSMETRGRHFLKLGLSAGGSDKMYAVNDMVHFLDAFKNQGEYHFSKNFIFESEKMYVKDPERKILEHLYNMIVKRESLSSERKPERYSNEIILDEDECERLLDLIWDDLKNIRMRKQPERIYFENDMQFIIKVEKSGAGSLMSVDYSEYGDFEPLTLNFRYIYFERKGLVVKPSEEKRELIMNLYPFKNEENIVCFQVGANDRRFFQKNFLDKYCDRLTISIDPKVKEEITANRLLVKVYFDIALKGIVSKIEFCYGDKVINPLDDIGADKSIRESDREKEALAKLKSFGFRSCGRLFLLDDVEKIMFLLTDRLAELKKIAEVYYSVDFKKLHVKNLDGFGLSLADDGSVIHMNINLENITDEELAGMLDAIKRGKRYYRLKNGSIVNLGSAVSSRVVDLINGLDINKDSIHGGIFEIPLSRCMYLDNYLREKNVENVTIDSKFGTLMKKVSHPDDVEVKLSGHLKSVLRNYQITGVKWLKTMAGYSFGGVLADDMGIGKTIQVLAFISSEKQQKQQQNQRQTQKEAGHLPCMVVAPTSVIYNWRSEAEKFTPDLKVLVVTGSKDKRKLLICGSYEYDLLVTSYGALKNDIEYYQNIKFSYVFVDEAQNIKNPATLNANRVKSLNAKCAFALTGTPIENRLMELWSIFDLIMPGLLYDRLKFQKIYEEPIIREKNAEKMKELSTIIRPFIIRRMKKDVLYELPEKIETNYYTEMKEEQKKYYAAFYKDVKNEILPKIDKSGISNNHIEIFSALTRLRQICAHPGTFLENYNGGSGKLDFAMEIITKSMESGHSILLFSQFTKMLKIIQSELEKNSINYYYLDGKMKPEERIMEIDNFNHDREAVFLISLKAGGCGLNLTKADVVIHFDPWWNPAVENQASDRAYRIGQKNVLQVYNLLTEGTIEEMMAQLKDKKKNLLDSLIRPEEDFIYKLSVDEIRGLFTRTDPDSDSHKKSM